MPGTKFLLEKLTTRMLLFHSSQNCYRSLFFKINFPNNKKSILICRKMQIYAFSKTNLQNIEKILTRRLLLPQCKKIFKIQSDSIHYIDEI